MKRAIDRPDRAKASRAGALGAKVVVRDVSLLLAAWLAFAAAVSGGHLVTAYDSFRDMASAHAMLRGEWGGDPTVPGLPAWYPAGNSVLFAAVARLTGASVLQVYGTNLFWFSWTLPVALWLLLARGSGRAVAWASLAFLALGSRWWLTHLAMPMPSIQGVAFGALTLMAWLAARERGWPLAVGTGALGAIAILFHPICGGLPMATILIHGGLSPFIRARGEGTAERWRPARQALLAAGVCAAAAAPMLVPILAGPVLNAAPRQWFGPELMDARFVLHAGTPLVLPLGLAGFAQCVRSFSRLGWLVAYAGVALAGTAAGYAAHELGWPVPYLIPHEFQWHLQLAWCVAAALATCSIARTLALRWPAGKAGPIVYGTVIAALALGPALLQWPSMGSYVLRLDERWTPMRALASEISSLAEPGAVLGCEPELGYFLSGLAGTRAQLLPEGHLNTRASVKDRVEAMRTLLQTDEEPRFLSALERLPLDLLLHLPVDPRQMRTLEQRYAGWDVLRRIPLSDSTVFFFRVLRDTPAPPVALERSLR